MKIDFTVSYDAYFDLEQAVEDFNTILYFNSKTDFNTALYDAVEENISYPVCLEELPQEVIKVAVDALRKRLGGIQMRMELD